MVKILIFLTFIMSQGLSAQEQTSSQQQCRDLIGWIYKDFTLNNVDLSYKRLMQKLLISIHYANEYNKQSNKRALNNALDEFKSIDNDFAPFLQTPPRYKYPAFWRNIFGDDSVVPIAPSNLATAIARWTNLQKNNPEYFRGMDKKYLLDEWDNQTIEIVGNLSQYEFGHHSFKDKLQEISNNLDQANTEILKGERFDLDHLESSIHSTNNEVIAALIEGYNANSEKFESICPRNELSLYIQANNLLCPIPDKESGVEDIRNQLRELQILISSGDILKATEPKVSLRSANTTAESQTTRTPPVEITRLNYRTSPLRAATYCKRPAEMATMIVLHHTGTDHNPLRINNGHINDHKNDKEPWYMIGYNYVIEDDFMHGTRQAPQIFQGRPAEMKGAHAGGYTSRLTRSEKQFYQKFPIMCGNEKVGFKASSIEDHMDNRGGISGNLASIGIAISGDFTPVRIRTIAGVAQPVNINRSRAILPSMPEIKKVVELSCELQRQNPNLKTFVPHSYFKRTNCPAALLLYFKEILRETAKIKGCSFKAKLKKGSGFL